MDLPTYTNIWRIEKRLYKLYDLRLPMPLPIVWIGVFVGVSVPWWLLLWLVGLPFDAPWHVVYLVPPGVLTWLSTRPVIESKRLTELLQTQLRYLVEPRTWCRMAPKREPDEIAFTVRVWRSRAQVAARGAVREALCSELQGIFRAHLTQKAASRKQRRYVDLYDANLPRNIAEFSCQIVQVDPADPGARCHGFGREPEVIPPAVARRPAPARPPRGRRGPVPRPGSRR